MSRFTYGGGSVALGRPLQRDMNGNRHISSVSMVAMDERPDEPAVRMKRYPKKKGASQEINEFARKRETSTEFTEWEEEEVVAQRQSMREQMSDLIEDGGSANQGDLPAYMLKLLDQYAARDDFGKIIPVAEEPVKVGKLPVLALLGRPNTGKSTLYNKLTNSYKDGAIVHDEPGITRDRTYRLGEWLGYNFQVVDTGGIVFDDNEDQVRKPLSIFNL